MSGEVSAFLTLFKDRDSLYYDVMNNLIRGCLNNMERVIKILQGIFKRMKRERFTRVERVIQTIRIISTIMNLTPSKAIHILALVF